MNLECQLNRSYFFRGMVTRTAVEHEMVTFCEHEMVTFCEHEMVTFCGHEMKVV